MAAPASLLMPTTPSAADNFSPFSAASVLLSSPVVGGQEEHFISRKQFERWEKANPEIKLRPMGMVPVAGEVRKTSYMAPQHPTSHLLQSIPPRAPSRSSRSNILSYTLHLATATRLNAYNSPTGARSLLSQAEQASGASSSWSDRSVEVDDQWLTEELRAQGLWKTSESLLSAQKREGPLPPSVQRRVGLALLASELLAEPEPTTRVSTEPISVRDSEKVLALQALKPLTSPDTTTLYDNGGAPIAVGGHAKAVAKSLIDLKFANQADGESTSQLDAKPSGSDSDGAHPFFAGQGGNSEGESSTARLTAEPHMDYRIVRGHEMRTRAKAIFAESFLPSESSAWCRRHRCKACAVCKAAANLGAPSRTTRALLPGQGLDPAPNAGSKKALVELVPEFLVLSAALLNDQRERAAQFESEAAEYTVRITPNADIAPTAAWYNLFHSLVVQACLEGYLVDGWTGTSAIEVLFGCGCGVWEGKGWASRVAEMNKTVSNAPAKEEDESAMEGVEYSSSDGSSSGSDSSSDEESEDDEELERVEKLDKERRLIEAAQALFGTREVPQADFERNMRDRIHEFLNVPELGSFQPALVSLTNHLSALNDKYKLSTFESDMVDFLESTQRQLGKPALARYEQGPTVAGRVPAGEPDPYALSRFFARGEGAGEAGSPKNWAGSIGNEPVSLGKRRRE